MGQFDGDDANSGRVAGDAQRYRVSGTNLHHYAYAIEDLHRNGPRPADTEWRAALTKQAEHAATSPPDALAASNGAHPRSKILNWLDAHMRRTRSA
jgi:hypothetical protein